MKGLYLNVPDAAARIREIDGLLHLESSTVQARPARGLSMDISFHPEDWPAGPVHHDPRSGLFAAGSGWFLYKGKLGNLAEFAADFASAVQADSGASAAADIEAGAFVLYVRMEGKGYLITDPFGLHPHYVSRSDPPAVAPAPCFVAGHATPDPELEATLQAQNHLFGNLTSYADVLRLDPGSVICEGRNLRYFDYRPGDFSADFVLDGLSLPTRFFDGRRRLLPLSGGLDSRLLLAVGSYDYGYTFGPARTGDRPVARRYRWAFETYDEFSLLELNYPNRLRKAADVISRGVCARPFAELLAVYSRLHRRFGRCVFFDGYLGDVLQRGLYLTHSGLGGHLSKFFPGRSARRFDPMHLLRSRYRALTDREFERLAAVYDETTGGWELDDARKLVLFEILYGRGARHVLNGGTTMSFQFFTPAQPFAMPGVFLSLFGLDPFEARSYGNLARIWRHVPREFASVRTYSGFRPTWPPWLCRIAMLGWKGLARTGLHRRAASYEQELPRVRWGEE